MIRTRVLTVAVLLPLLLVLLWLGSWAWLALVAAIAAVAVHEVCGLYARVDLPVSRAWAWAAGGVAFATTAVVAFGDLPSAALALGPLLALCVSLVAFLLAPGERPYRAFLGVAGAALYPAWLLGFVLLLRLGPRGLGTTFWLLAVIWLSDAAGYGGGKLIGGTHVVPGISPGKTLSGFVAGFVVSVGAAAAMGRLIGVAPVPAAALGAVVTLAAQFGDLAESLLKRRAGVKDSGTILPGHGGMLDRFDGVLIGAPVLYYCLTLWHP